MIVLIISEFIAVYVDAADGCNDLSFTLGPTTAAELVNAGILTAAVRSWNIKVCKNIHGI